MFGWGISVASVRSGVVFEELFGVELLHEPSHQLLAGEHGLALRRSSSSRSS